LHGNAAHGVRQLSVLRSVDRTEASGASFDRTGKRCRIAAWPRSRRMCIIALLALLSAAVALASGYVLRPAITTHLLVFALGALYGGVMRWKKSPSRTRVSRDPKSLGYRAGRLPYAAPQRRFVKLARRHDS
jgi:hypothetical protein